MTYTITTTAGQVLTTITDGTVNTTATSLALVGKNYAGYGIFLNENYVQLLENFNNSTAPQSPLTGQLWYDNVNDLLKVYNSSTNIWKPISSSIAQATAPAGAVSVTGDLWWDTTNAQLKVYSGSAWVTIGPIYATAAGTSGPVTESIQDTLGGSHVVTKFYIQNSVIAIISKDATFTPAVALPGFSTVIPGMNLISSSTLSGAQFTGTVVNAQQLGGLTNTQFLRSDQAASTNYLLTLNGGVNVSDVNMDASGTSAFNVTVGNLNKDYQIYVNQAGVNSLAWKITATSLQTDFSGNAVPAANNVQQLGISSRYWRFGYINEIRSTGYINTTGNISGNIIRAGSFYGDGGNITGTASNFNVSYATTSGNIYGWPTPDQQLSTINNVTFANLTIKNIIPSANVTYTCGSLSNRWLAVYATTFYGNAVTALYADLAERFAADTIYSSGTVVQLGGTAEITAAQDALSEDVFGVISTNAGFLMNGAAGDNDTHPPVAVSGRVPVRVVGTVRKGDRLVSAGGGLARAAHRSEITPFNVIGRALEDKHTTDIGMLEAIVKLNS